MTTFNTEELKTKLSKLTEEELNLVKLLIFHYKTLQTSKAPDQVKEGYRYAFRIVIAVLDIASSPDIDLRPSVEQQIDKLVKSLSELVSE